jgi:hypothetical protein
MPRRVFPVSAHDAELHGLADPGKLRAFLAPRVPDLMEWTAALHPSAGGYVVVLDHADPGRPLHLLAHHRPGGRPHADVHVARPACVLPDCDEEAIHGTSHCHKHLGSTP